jgi:hypothetical protein
MTLHGGAYTMGKELSYDLHDGYELELMLAGKKPLSFFYENVDVSAADSTLPEVDFQKFVDDGRICKEEFILEAALHPVTQQPIRIRYLFYAIKGEEWRIPAMILVIKTMIANKKAPDEGLDRIVGSLLGYTNSQNDEYIDSGRY